MTAMPYMGAKYIKPRFTVQAKSPLFSGGYKWLILCIPRPAIWDGRRLWAAISMRPVSQRIGGEKDTAGGGKMHRGGFSEGDCGSWLDETDYTFSISE